MKPPQMKCVSCQKTYQLGEIYRCPADDGELEIVYDYKAIRRGGMFGRRSQRSESSIQRFFYLLPLLDPDAIVSLGEGDTPLVRARRLAERVGVRELYLKLETCNPTGSFKDRQVSVAISRANEWKKTRFGTVSSGNVGIALSAYCAAAGFQANVWVADDTPVPKRRQIQVYGANVFLFPSPDRNGIEYYQHFFNGLLEFAQRNGLVPMISARPVNPYMVEGSKIISFEIVLDLGRAPDRLFCPVGGGGLTGGLWKGFKELQAIGQLDRLPMMNGVQRIGHITPISELPHWMGSGRGSRSRNPAGAT
jgi:threonine synthase